MLFLSHYDLIVDVHIQNPAIRINILLELRWPVERQRLIAIDLAGEHENTRKSGNMVCMHMADENGVDLFPLQIEHFQGDLCTFSAIKQKEVPITADHGTGQVSVGKGHHPAGPEYEHFKIHAGSIAENGA